MTSTKESNLGLGDLLKMIQRHRVKSILTFIILFILCVGTLFVLPRTYESEVLFFVRLGRESVTLDPTATTGQTITLNESRDSELNSILRVIQSRALMSKVVDRLGPEAILSPPSSDETATFTQSIKSGVSSTLGRLSDMLEPSGTLSPREKAIQKITKHAYVSNARRSKVISIRYRARSPQQAQTIAQAISDEYLLEHRRIHTTQGSYDFFVQQAERFSKILESSVDALRIAKNEMDLTSIEGKRLLIENRILTLATAKQTSQSALSASKARILSLQQLMAGLPERVNTQQVEGMPNLAGDQMRSQLYQLELREKELLSKYTDNHPLVVVVREQVRNAEDIVKKQAASRVYTTMAVNPAAQKLELDLLVERASAESLEAKLVNLRQQHQLALADMQEVNLQEQRVITLQQKITLAEKNFFAYAEKREQARIQQALDEQHISNINITQPATFVEKPISPKKSIVLVAGFLVSCLGAFCVAIRAELYNPRLRSQEEVEAELDMPVVVTIPAVARSRVLLN
jgi:uncharacterized protein involved in exopolysaccharide biosynthesis